MMDRETRINKKPANIRNQRIKLEESYVPSLEDEGMGVQNLLPDPKMDHLPVDEAFCFDMLDSSGAQGQDGLGFGVLDSFLDGIDEVDDIYAANDISGACEDFILDDEVMEKAAFLDGVLCGGSRLSNSSSESQSPRLSGSSNGALVLSESSTVTITESECLNVCNEKRVNCEFNAPSRVNLEATVLKNQDMCTNSYAFDNRTDCDDSMRPSKSQTASDRYGKKPVQLIRGVAITREKRMHKPTKRYIEEFTNCKPKQSLEAGKVLSVAPKDKLPIIMWQNEHNQVGARRLSSDEFHANNVPDDECEDIEEVSDKRLRRMVSRRKIVSAASKDKQLKDESRTLPSEEFHTNNLTDDESEDMREIPDRKLRRTVGRQKIVSAVSKDKQLKDESENGLLYRTTLKHAPFEHSIGSISQEPSESRPRRGRPKKNSPYLMLKYDDQDSSSESEGSCVKRKRSKKKDDRRKHQRMWTLAEVMKLIDGIAQYGTGRWTDIKKLLFSSSAYRTPVDLRDKWRNLLRASCAEKQKQNKKEVEQKLKHAMRPLPKAVLRRIRELASLHPYPRFMPGGRYTRSRN